MTAALKVVVPVEVIANAPSAPLVAPPIMPLKPIAPEPDVIVKPLPADAVLPTLAALLSVLANETVPLPELAVVFKVMLAAKVAASP